jgi:hypothetical protein
MALALLEETARCRSLHFPFLIRLGQRIVFCLDPFHLSGPLGPFGGVGQCGDEVGDGARGEELVGAVV